MKILFNGLKKNLFLKVLKKAVIIAEKSIQTRMTLTVTKHKYCIAIHFDCQPFILSVFKYLYNIPYYL